MVISFKRFVVAFVVVGLFFVPDAWAVPAVPASQEASSVEAARRREQEDLKLRKEIRSKRITDAIETPAREKTDVVPAGEKVLVKRFEIIGLKQLSAAELSPIVAPYENKELTFGQMQEVAGRITDHYRQKGYITTRAVVPPQKIDTGVVQIQVFEGVMGKVSVEGNKYYRTSFFMRRMPMKKGEAFNYFPLRTTLNTLNRSQDRKVKAVLMPGQNAGDTDLVLKVEDRLPVHAGFSYDNYGSRYSGKSRYQGNLTHNDLLGFDDSLSLTWQLAEGHNTYRLASLRYLFPLTSTTKVGVFGGDSQLLLGREYADLNARGKSKTYGVFVDHILWSDELTEWSVNGGFDYKDVFNFQVEQLTSRDRMRVAHVGGKWDSLDALGRTLVSNDVSKGIPGLWGGLDDKDPKATRLGSGGEFTKDVLSVLRLQRMPMDASLFLRGQAQFASRILTSTEQYQLGGATDVRGYPAGEAVGDNGQSGTVELTFPVYGISKSLRAPGSKQGRLYDALKLVVFYDAGRVTLRSPGADARKAQVLKSAGCGVRYDLPENFSIRLDFAWPTGIKSSDSNGLHTWIKISKEF